MSHLIGYAWTTYDYLVENLGEPGYKRPGTYAEPLDDSDGKVSAQWEFDSFNVYDWKQDKTPKGLHYWHIGGEDETALKEFHEVPGSPTISN